LKGGDRKRRETELKKILSVTGINPKILKDKKQRQEWIGAVKDAIGEEEGLQGIMEEDLLAESFSSD
jgi:hypothetical protein